jgi:hypothetical protein
VARGAVASIGVVARAAPPFRRTEGTAAASANAAATAAASAAACAPHATAAVDGAAAAATATAAAASTAAKFSSTAAAAASTVASSSIGAAGAAAAHRRLEIPCEGIAVNGPSCTAATAADAAAPATAAALWHLAATGVGVALGRVVRAEGGAGRRQAEEDTSLPPLAAGAPVPRRLATAPRRGGEARGAEGRGRSGAAARPRSGGGDEVEEDEACRSAAQQRGAEHGRGR